MGAGAPIGNKNAEVWTLEISEELILRAIEMSNEKKTFNVQGRNIEGYAYDFIGEIARELDTYHCRLTRDTPNKFPELKPLVEKLKYNLEANCFSNTKKGIIKEATGIVNLKANYKWSDRVITENTNTNINTSLSSDEREKLIAKLEQKAK